MQVAQVQTIVFGGLLIEGHVGGWSVADLGARCLNIHRGVNLSSKRPGSVVSTL